MKHLKTYKIFESSEIEISDQNLIKEIFLDVFDNFLNDNCFNFSKPEDFFPIEFKHSPLTYTYKYYSNRNSLIFSMIIPIGIINDFSDYWKLFVSRLEDNNFSLHDYRNVYRLPYNVIGVSDVMIQFEVFHS
jgi:hypothetical protein